jgi:Family of unknown function (DUF6084)
VPELNFAVDLALPLAHAASPHLVFKVRISEPVAPDQATTISAIALRCQIRIEPARRRYAPDEAERLLDLFGETHRWGQTLKSTLWTHASVVVRPFTGQTVVDLPVPCSFDFNVAATKYFHALADGEVPLTFLFSGTIFYMDKDEFLQVSQISWEKEATFRLPVQVWKDMMELYYPQSAWLCLRQDVFDRLYQYKTHRGLPTWEQALDALLDLSEAEVTP